jgi:mannose-1-phosphate guanylyltransferase/mannose-6-phosphate isomerase
VTRIVPAIMCGGSGTRLWPLSRAARPKQMLALTGAASLLAQTVARTLALPAVSPDDLLMLAGETFPLDLLRAETAAGGGGGARLILEPEPRNTAPAAALAAFAALDRDQDSIVLLLPSDHHIGDGAQFATAVAAGAALAGQDYIVTFGIEPSGPHSGYGYIARGEPLGAGYRVKKFLEKPSLEKASALIEEGGYLWNSGIYMFRPRTYIDELAKYEPDVRAQVEAAWRGARTEGGVTRPETDAWAKSPKISIDNAVAERTGRAAVIPAAMAWSDIGSWDALWDITAKDSGGNVHKGTVVSIGAKNTYVHAENRMIALVGVEDLVVVETGDVIAIAPRGRTEEIKKLVERLQASEHKDLL